MKFWYLDETLVKDNPHPTYDSYTFRIVRAPDEATARQLASQKPGDEGSAFWLNPKWCNCVEYEFPTLEGEAEVVWEEFHPG